LLLEIDAYGPYILNKKEVGTAKGIATGTTTYILAAPHTYLPYISAAQLDSTSPILIGGKPTQRSENWNQVCSGRLINEHPILLLTDM
jgi:hypothetical protein